MSWKVGLSRHLPIVRFFACSESPSSRGVFNWYQDNYYELKMLNPTMPLFLRTGENTLPAVTTELSFTTNDVLKFMIDTGRFRDENGTINEGRIEAAKSFLNTNWSKFRYERWASPGFDPEKPFLDERQPNWREENPKVVKDLQLYLGMKNDMNEQIDIFKSGPNDEYKRAEAAMMMIQRVDLWCAGPKEVEAAVIHLYQLGKKFNGGLECDFSDYISEYYAGAPDLS